VYTQPDNEDKITPSNIKAHDDPALVKIASERLPPSLEVAQIKQLDEITINKIGKNSIF
jgi:hypothetical protein